MELPRRARGDEFVPPGRFRELQHRLARLVGHRDIPTLFVYAFDNRTRVGPFLFIDKMLIPGAALALGAALRAVGINRVRLVLQQWTPHVLPSRATIHGSPPELLLISSMQIHSAAAYDLIRDACGMGDDRPLILAGGAKAIYQPWDFFSLSPDGRQGADVVVIGEEYVVYQLLEVVIGHRGPRETMLHAFRRVRRAGLLNDIPGLVFRPDGDESGNELIHTGIQRLVQDLDELPSMTAALDRFEPPHRGRQLAAQALSARQLGRQAQIAAMVTTHGCKFHCSYCPIPGYNQFTFRHKSPARLTEDMRLVHEQSGIKLFFGTDDNLFNHRASIETMLTTMAQTKIEGKPFGEVITWATEATEFDVWKNRDLLPVAHAAGLRLVWFGVEDLTAELVKKGQSPEKTRMLFQEMLQQGIGPMPMMMHHDGQPLVSRGNLYGLLNQTRFLRRAGAFSFQVTFLTPSIGSKGYEQPFDSGMVFQTIGDRSLEDHWFDGNHCIATEDTRPWRKQLNLMIAYAMFYNPLSLVRDFFRFDSLWKFRMVHGVLGHMQVWRSLPHQLRWLWRLRRGPLRRATAVPEVPFRISIPNTIDPDLVHYGLGIHAGSITPPLPGEPSGGAPYACRPSFDGDDG